MAILVVHPEIRIKDGWLLRENASQYLHRLWGSGDVLVDDTWMTARVQAYQEAWLKYEKKIMKGLYNITGLQFRQNIIDVYIAPWFSAFSDPMVIGVMREPDEFVDVLTHELIHRLLTDNTSKPADTEFATDWGKLFGAEYSFTTLVHIPVHAIHKAIYMDILKDRKRLERDRDFDKAASADDYTASWSYVESKGYKEIIDILRNYYTHGS